MAPTHSNQTQSRQNEMAPQPTMEPHLGSLDGSGTPAGADGAIPSTSTQPRPDPVVEQGGGQHNVDDEEGRNLDELSQMHEELLRKKRQLEALERQNRIRVIRLKAAEAREELRRLDERLAAAEVRQGLESDTGLDGSPSPNPSPRRSPPPHPQPPQPNLRHNHIYPNPPYDYHPQGHRANPQLAIYVPKSPLSQILQTTPWPLLAVLIDTFYPPT